MITTMISSQHFLGIQHMLIGQTAVRSPVQKVKPGSDTLAPSSLSILLSVIGSSLKPLCALTFLDILKPTKLQPFHNVNNAMMKVCCGSPVAGKQVGSH